jgi:adenosine deaminase CECR1
MVGSPTMNLHGWRQLAEWSIEYSSLTVSEKQRALNIHHKEWVEFCKWIIDEFGMYADGLDVKL